jgi:probable O-glycosylation ligase (exosortase A-associated)
MNAELTTTAPGVQTRDTVAFSFLTAFAVVMYAAPAEWIPVTAPLRPALVTSVAATALMLLRRVGRAEAVLFDGVRGVALLAFCALAAASTAWSIVPEITKDAAIELLKLAAIYLTFVNLVTTPKRLAVVASALVLASIVTSVGAIQWYLGGVDLVEGFRARWVGGYADPNRLGMALALVVPIALAFVIRPKASILSRVVFAAAVGLAVTAIVFSHSRGTFLGMSIGLAIWLVRDRRFMQGAAVALVLAGMLVFAPKSFWDRTETVSSYEQDASARGRIEAWKVTSNMSRQNPLLGIGFNAFQPAWPLYADPGMRRAYAAHNVFLQTIAELGFIGFALFLLFAAGAVGGAFEAATAQSDRWLTRAIAAATAGYLICNLSSGFVLSPHFFVAMGLAASSQRVFQRK